MSSPHAEALETLRSWSAPDDGQERLRQRYLGHLESHHDALQRSGRPDHLTASTLVLSADRRRVLLTLHAKAERWFQFGGHCEPDDPTLAATALREAVEESGLSRDDLTMSPTPTLLDAHLVPFCGPGEGVHHLDVMFAAVARDAAEPAVSEESLDVAWWPVDDLPEPELDAFVRRALAALSPGTPAAE